MIIDTLSALGLGFAPAHASIARIDHNHTNPHATWLAMGSPNYPTPARKDLRIRTQSLQFSALRFFEPGKRPANLHIVSAILRIASQSFALRCADSSSGGIKEMTQDPV